MFCIGENEEEAARLMMLKARTQVLNRQMKALKKELKSAVLPGSQGVTCEFVRSNIEYQCKNYRKSIKMLNSGAQSAGNKVFPHYYNNLGCIHQNMKKPNLAVYYFKNAMEKLDNGGSDAAPQLRVDGEKDISMSMNGIPRSQVILLLNIRFRSKNFCFLNTFGRKIFNEHYRMLVKFKYIIFYLNLNSRTQKMQNAYFCDTLYK